jgi:hypothetical protein
MRVAEVFTPMTADHGDDDRGKGRGREHHEEHHKHHRGHWDRWHRWCWDD